MAQFVTAADGRCVGVSDDAECVLGHAVLVVVVAVVAFAEDVGWLLVEHVVFVDVGLEVAVGHVVGHAVTVVAAGCLMEHVVNAVVAGCLTGHVVNAVVAGCLTGHVVNAVVAGCSMDHAVSAVDAGC